MSRWSLKPLGEICSTTSGGTPSRSHPEYFGGAIPWIKSGDLTDGDVIACDENITEEAIRSSSAKLFPQGTVLVAMYGATVGKLGMLGMEAATNQAVCGITPSDELDRWFLFYFLLSQRQNLIGQSAGGAQPNISQKIVRELLVPVPPLPEQRRIVDLLSRAEGIVRLRREAEKKAAELIPALFLDMFGDPATNPKGWETKSLDCVLTDTKLGLVRGAKEMADDKAFPYLRMDGVDSGNVRTTKLKRVDATSDEASSFSLRYGDFLFNTRNSKELVGKTGMFVGADEPIVLFNNNLMRMRFDKKVLLPEFVNALFQTAYIQNQLESIKRGTTSVFAIYFKDLRHLHLRTPPIGLQSEFANRASAIFSIRSQQSSASVKAQATFDALLSQAFSNNGANV